MGNLVRWVDDFYAQPDLIREIALRSEYFEPKGQKGYRSTKGYLPAGTLKRIQEAFGFEELNLLDQQRSTTHFYHCLVRGPQRTRFFAHVDFRRNDLHASFSMVVYLSLHAPKDSGTGIYRHRETGLWQDPTTEDARRLGKSKRELRTLLEDDDASIRSRWELLDSCQHVYNRAVVFPAHWFHSSCRDFGSRLETGRLYQAFFFTGYPDVFATEPEQAVSSAGIP
jgi:hypothetical protein